MITKPIIEKIKEIEENPNLHFNYVEIEKINHEENFTYIAKSKWFSFSSLKFVAPIAIILDRMLFTKFTKKFCSFIATFTFTVSSSSILLNLFNIYSYQEQLNIVPTKDFSITAMMWYSIFCALIIICGTFSATSNGKLSKKFSSIWVPFSTIMRMSLFIPDSQGISVFSYFVKIIISFIMNLY